MRVVLIDPPYVYARQMVVEDDDGNRRRVPYDAAVIEAQGGVIEEKAEPVDYVPVKAPLSVLQAITKEQAARVRVLASGFHANEVRLSLDSFYPGAVLFVLINKAGEGFYNGLIEPDGSTHT